MTGKQVERIRTKITKIKSQLAADKKRWGGYYHDGRGLRYLPPGLFIQIKDYKGGLRYLQWFNRTFPDDSGYPIFLFEWTMILFKTGNMKEARKKAYETYMSNVYIFDKFLGRDIKTIDKWEGSNWESISLTEELKYTKDDTEYADFADWLEILLANNNFHKFKTEFLDIEKRLKTEPIGETRKMLVSRRYCLIDDL
jgi:hypothetical protein